MPRADAYYFIIDPVEIQQIAAATAGGMSLVAAAHGIAAGRPTAPFAYGDLTADEVDAYEWTKDDCMDVLGTRWAARWVGGIVVLTRAPTVVGLWA